MSPKGKAIELVDKFTQTNGNNFFAKQCALITVDEVWRQLEAARVFEEYDYWQEVKKEIERL